MWVGAIHQLRLLTITIIYLSWIIRRAASGLRQVAGRFRRTHLDIDLAIRVDTAPITRRGDLPNEDSAIRPVGAILADLDAEGLVLSGIAT